MKSHKQIKCPECKGEGHFLSCYGVYVNCAYCNGTGTISKPEEVKPRKRISIKELEKWGLKYMRKWYLQDRKVK